MSCTYDDATGWTTNGNPCGEEHCYGHRCSAHVNPGELICPSCIATTREHIADIVRDAALMLPEAIHRGINSEAANLAGPAPHPGTARARWEQGRSQAQAAAFDGERFDAETYNRLVDRLPDDDPQHPYAVLGRWELMLREDYGPATHEPITVASAAKYLNAVMHRLANDPMQDFPLFARDMRRCRAHLAAVLRANPQIERGAPCHLCDTGTFVKHYAEALGHYGRRDRAGYLLDDEGHRIPADEWRCRHCGATLSDESYRRIVEASYVATADRLSMSDLATRTQIPKSTLKRWASGEWKRGTWVEPSLVAVGLSGTGRKLYRVDDALTLRAGRNGDPSGMVSLEGVE